MFWKMQRIAINFKKSVDKTWYRCYTIYKLKQNKNTGEHGGFKNDRVRYFRI